MEIPLYDGSSLKKGKKLGEGGFGVVTMGKLHEHTTVAIKFLNDGNKIEELQKEADFMVRITHPYIIKCYGFCFIEEKYGMVLEYADEGSLFKLIFESQEPLDIPKVYECGSQISCGMEYLIKTYNISHRDLKPQNILMTRSYDVQTNSYRLVAKITDFGMAKQLNTNPGGPGADLVSAEIKGTWGYISPEALDGPNLHQGEKSDVFSYGVILYEMCTRKQAFPRDMKNYVHDVVIKKIRPDISSIQRMSTNMSKLIQKCWSNDSTHRPSFSQITRGLTASRNPQGYPIGTHDDVEQYIHPPEPSSRPQSSVTSNPWTLGRSSSLNGMEGRFERPGGTTNVMAQQTYLQPEYQGEFTPQRGMETYTHMRDHRSGYAIAESANRSGSSTSDRNSSQIDGIEVALSNVRKGFKVRRGRHWIYGDEDGGSGCIGKLKSQCYEKGWCLVKWGNGYLGKYRIGANDCFDLVFANQDANLTSTRLSIGTKVTLSSRYKKYGDANKGPLRPGDEGIIIDIDGSDQPYRVQATQGKPWWYHKKSIAILGSGNATHHLADQNVTDHNARVGYKVCRSADWPHKENQDGGAGKHGTLVKSLKPGWWQVSWAHGGMNSYRTGDSGKYEIKYCLSREIDSSSSDERD